MRITENKSWLKEINQTCLRYRNKVASLRKGEEMKILIDTLPFALWYKTYGNVYEL
jgi:hypothetical protein